MLGKLDDFIKRNIEISTTIPTSPSLFCVDSHASFGHVQREGCIVTGGGA